MDKAQERRNVNYELMRSASAFAVVWLHVAAQFATSSPDAKNLNWWLANVADAFSRWSVPVFVMLSGALLLKQNKYASARIFYKSRLSRLLIPLVFWTFFYVAFRYLTEPMIDAGGILKDILIGKPYFHLWYLYMIVGLYAITPYLHIITRHIDPTSLLTLIVFSLTISSIEFLLGAESKTFLTKFIAYIGYFLGGYYLSIHNPKLQTFTMAAGVAICGILIALLTGYYLPRIGSEAINIMYGYLNPLVIALSFFTFSILIKIRIDNSRARFFIERTASLSLGIYLIHPIWLWLLNRYIFWRFRELNIATIPLLSIIVFSLSMATAHLIVKSRWGKPII